MQRFHSLQSDSSDDVGFSDEGMLEIALMPSSTDTNAVQTAQINPLPVFASTEQTRAVQVRQTDSYNPVVVQNGQATRSLVLALHSTMQPSALGVRPPIVIPGNRKRQLSTQVLVGPEEKAGINLHTRHVLVALASLCVLMLSMFSLTPLGSGQSGIPVFDGAASWVQTERLNLSIMVGQVAQVAQPTPAPVVQSVAPATTTTTTTTILPESQYVAIAEAAATQYGIDPATFVRQINQESGFNPYAVSPSGAVGIAQFEPSTAAAEGVDPYDPQSALYGAAQLMANLSTQYGGDYSKALAAYNAGSGAVDAAVSEGGANWLSYLPAETQNYVAIIMG
jgi:hypothetical protein